MNSPKTITIAEGIFIVFLIIYDRKRLHNFRTKIYQAACNVN